MQKISKKHPCRVNTIQTDCVITFFKREGISILRLNLAFSRFWEFVELKYTDNENRMV